MDNRRRAIALYKELHRLGREYPDPEYNYHRKIRHLFEQIGGLTDQEEIDKRLRLAEYIKQETLALYALRKYRHLRRAYPPSS
ncbi:hypothetical protein B0H15DRAFT_809313 [Mycena belliarum]|uniref:Complex 1 LYR protein domain-containing protein n=1 Tax=Mycena belliarum TaxID=1033014 RepID=A0AAD6Y054_9AGAR|nr:hypothetical protein B0H15DRAFT_809313 [Mycena belliae]